MKDLYLNKELSMQQLANEQLNFSNRNILKHFTKNDMNSCSTFSVTRERHIKTSLITIEPLKGLSFKN